MDEIWEKAVETALNGESSTVSVRSLTLDGVIKCFHGRLPPPDLLRRYQNLEHLSIANIGVSSLENFPHLPKLQKLIMSDNRISSGLEFLVQAGLRSLRDLDLSNNRIQFMEDLAPLAEIKLVSLDLYECPVTKVEDYRSRVFGLIRSLKYLDKMDADENERPESDEEDEDEDEDEEEEEEEDDDPGSGEIDGEAKLNKSNTRIDGGDVFEVDEDEESDADDDEVREVEEMIPNGHTNNELREEDDVEDEDEDDVEYLGEEVEDEDQVNGDGENDDDSDDDDDDDDVEEIDEDDNDDDVEEINDEEEDVELVTTGRLTSTDGEIDGHDRGEEDDDNGEIGEEEDNGEIGEEEDPSIEQLGDDDDDDDVANEDEEYGTEYLVQPIGRSEEDADSEKYGDDEVEDEDGTEFLVQPVGAAEEEDLGDSDFDVGDDSADEKEVDDEGVQNGKLPSQPLSSSLSKRKRGEEEDEVGEDEEDEGVQNGDLQSHPSVSYHPKKKRDAEDDDANSDAEDDSSLDGKFRRRH